MRASKEQGRPTPAELKKKFGEEADTYAEVRAEAAAAAGRREASDEWDELASDLRDEEGMDSGGE